MDAGGLSLLQTGIWLIPILLLGTVAGLYLLVRHWQNDTALALKSLRAQLRQFQFERNNLLLALQEHSRDDPEPYGSRVAAWQKQLAELDQRIGALEQHYVEINEAMHHLKADPWQATVGAPYYWYQLHTEAQKLVQNADASRPALEAVLETHKQINQLGWEVAQQARETARLHQQARQLLEQLYARSVRGGALEAAMQDEQHCRAALAQIPGFFFEGDEPAVRDQASKESIAQVHALCTELQPQAAKLLAQAQAWEQQYTAAQERVKAMRQVLDMAEQSLAALPAAVVVNEQKARLEQLKVIAQNLQATLARLEVESIPAVTQEARRVHQALQELDTQFKQVRQQYTALEQALAGHSEGIKQLSAQVASLGTAAKHPLTWGESRAQLAAISRQVNSLGTIKKNRSPQQIDQDLATANALKTKQLELGKHFQQAGQQHAELLNLLDSQEIAQAQAWLKNARQTAGRAAGYDPENWPRGDAVSTLPGDLETVSHALQTLAGGDPAEPIFELDLFQRLQQTKQLVQTLQGLGRRVESVQRRLDEVQQSEQLAREKLEHTHTLLAQVAALVRSNDTLKEAAQGEIDRLENSLQSLNADLDQRGRGAVDKKAKAIDAAAAKLELSSNFWLDRLNKELDALKKELAEGLTDLDAIAALDDPEVGEARRLLASGQAFGSAGYGGKSRFTVDEIILELKRRCDFGQSCLAALVALEDAVLNPVTEAYTAANHNRTAARDQLAKINDWLRSRRSWPPTSLTLEAPNQELGKVDEQWALLRQQRMRAINLVRQLTDLANRYYAVIEKAEATAQRIEAEQQQVETLEVEIDELMQSWNSLWQSYQEYPMAVQGIRRLLNEVDQERNQLRRQYRQGGLAYQQILQALQGIHRQLRVARIPFDESNEIDINGKFSTYR